MLTKASFLERNFGNFIKVPPRSGLYPKMCEYQVPQLSEMSTHSHSSEILQGPRGLVLPRDSTIRSCLLIQRTISFFDLN